MSNPNPNHNRNHDNPKSEPYNPITLTVLYETHTEYKQETWNNSDYKSRILIYIVTPTQTYHACTANPHAQPSDWCIL